MRKTLLFIRNLHRATLLSYTPHFVRKYSVTHSLGKTVRSLSVHPRCLSYSAPTNRRVHDPRKFDVDAEEVFTSGVDYLQSLSQNELSGQLDETMNKLSEVLYQLLLLKDQERLLKFFEIIKSKKLINEAAYTIMMRCYGEELNLSKVQEFFSELRTSPKVKVHSRSFIPLIIVSLRLGEFKLADGYYEEMVEEIQMKQKDSIIQELLNTCIQICDANNRVFIHEFVNKLFMLLERYGTSNLMRKTIETIVVWFESDKTESWSIQPTSIERNNMCRYCKQRLKKNSIPHRQLVNLKRNLLTVLKASMLRKESSRISDLKHLKTNINIKNQVTTSAKYFEFYDALTMQTTNKSQLPGYKEGTGDEIVTDISQAFQDAEITNAYEEDGLTGVMFEKLKDFKGYLNDNPRFDVVIDALNVGYYASGFNPAQVRNIVQYFVKKKKKVLILCAGIMKEDLITDFEVPAANRNLQKLMFFLDKHCSLYYVGSSMIDDYYILYTLIHHDFRIDLVSRDLFRDHLFHLNAENAADFQRYQRKHQFITKAIHSDGVPVFKPRMNFNQTMQRHKNGWHIPVSDESWLCVSKT